MKEVTIQGQTFQLHLEKAIYWVEEKTLILADLHFGKVTHFRKAGIAIPTDAKQSNWENLSFLISKTAPESLLLLGDLFHSELNHEWEEFVQILHAFPNIKTELVLGNHDILNASNYLNSGIKIMTEKISGPFIFTHAPIDPVPGSLYNICGHIHPAVRLKGRGRQALVLPCFYFGQLSGIVPAFGNFTGTSIIKHQKQDLVFVIAGMEIIKIK